MVSDDSTDNGTHGISRTVSILSRRKSLWKMVRSLLIPSKMLTTFAACGGVGRQRRRRLERSRNVENPILDRPRRRAPAENSGDSGPDTEATLAVNLTGLIISHNGSEDLETLQQPPENGTNTAADTASSSEPEAEVIRNDNVIQVPVEIHQEEVVVRRRPRDKDKTVSVNAEVLLGWRKSSIEVTSQPPLTLKWIPSGLQIGDRVIWIREEEESTEECASVRWIGKIRNKFYAGVEFDRPIGNSSGLYGYGDALVTRLFTCDLGYGKFIPVEELVLYSDFHDKGVKAGFICIICRDDFLELPTSEADVEENVKMVATKCGHLYHATCLEQWLASKLAKRRSTNGRPPLRDEGQPCPHCQNEITWDEVIRVFPAQV